MILRFELAAALLLSALAGNHAFTIKSAVPSRTQSSTSRLFETVEQGSGPSPEFFKKMGLDGGPPPPQQQQQQQQQPMQQQMQPPPIQPQQMSQPPPAQFFDANGNPVSMPMVYDANGNAVPFNPAGMQQQPPPPPQAAAPVVIEPPLPPKTKGNDDPRPVGRNSDAWTMSNTADVYFAQLKQDSKVRKIARMSGDVETANKVFADDSVREIGESWNENPYTKEKNLAEARSEIEGTVRMQVSGDDAPTITSGVSYKEMVEQRRAKQDFVLDKPKIVVQQPPPVVTASAPPPKVEQPPVAVTPAPPKVEQPPVVVTQAPPKVEQPPVVVTPAPPKVEQPPVVTASAPPKIETPKPVSSAPAEITDGEDVRQKIRTMQGLLLKHRGGPGFGAGRLRAPEAQRLEDTLEDVKALLRAEVGGESKPVETVAAVPASPVVEKPKQVVPEPSAIPAQPAVPPAAATASSSAQSPAIEDPLAGSIASVETALKVYQESSPAEKEANLVMFRQALMAAASATNRQIIESETKALRESMNATPPAPKAVVAAPPKESAPPAMGFPTTYAVTKPEEEESKVVATPAKVESEKKLDLGSTSDSDLQEELGLAVLKVDAKKVTSLLDAGLKMDEETTDSAFWAVVNAVDRAEALDQPLSGDVPTMLHHIFDADLDHLLTREQQRTNVTCMRPESLGANRIAMNSIFDDAAHKDIALEEGRRCEDGDCCDACSRNIFPTFASEAEISLETYPELASLTFNELETVSAATILQFMRLIERVRRTIAHEYGVPLKTILPLQAYSRKYVAGTTQKGGGGGEGDFVILHTDEATHTGYHYSCVIYLSTQGEDFEGGNFVFNDPADDDGEKNEIDDEYELSGVALEEAIRTTGRKLTPFHPNRGAAVIFSSGWENMHEVEKITSGTRYAVPAFFTTCPVPDAAYDQMVQGKPKSDEDIADDWLHLLLAHRAEQPHEALGRVKELLMKWHMLCAPLSEH